ncbi:hypothetical protein [Rubrivirga sp.]|uniref:hypothetical protein n=1 Tax=Rubrivirga sp. TaxID=1885344 RepID=UPI003C785F97
MAFIFDNLIAFLIGTTLLVALLFVQQRGRQTAIETSIRYQAEGQAASFVEIMSRDLENARTREQARAALGTYSRDALGGSQQRALGIHSVDGQTDWIEFVTLEAPDSGSASPLVPVAYKRQPLGRQIEIDGVSRDVYRITRFVFDGTGWVENGASPDAVVGFEVDVQGTPSPTNGTSRITELPRQVQVAVEFAYETPDLVAGDQEQTAMFGATRQGAMVRMYASGTGNRALPPRQPGPSAIPLPPWAPEYVPPPPSGGGPADPGGNDTADDDNSGRGGDSNPPNDPPPVVLRPSGRPV